MHLMMPSKWCTINFNTGRVVQFIDPLIWVLDLSFVSKTHTVLHWIGLLPIHLGTFKYVSWGLSMLDYRGYTHILNEKIL